MTDSPDVPPWALGVWDQMQAALEHKDPAAYGRIALDGMLRASQIDAEGGKLDYNVAMRNIVSLDKGNLLLVMAEALCRLYNKDMT